MSEITHSLPERLSVLFEPCKTKEELALHMKAFLGIELPDGNVDEDSNSNPMQFVFDVYESMLNGGPKTRFVAMGGRNTAKCLKEGTLVATPKGPVEIQNLRAGDTVFDENGNPVKVLALHDQGMQECVDLVNSRKVLATCTPNHIWSIYDQRRPTNFRDAKTENIGKHALIKRVELNLPLGEKREPLAYALGALLGDGCSVECGIVISSKNDLIPNKVASVLGTIAVKHNSENYSYRIAGPGMGVKWQFSDFYEKNIRQKRSYEKTTDLDEIKTWDRLSLLEFVAGLLDTDGSVFETTVTGRQIHVNFGMQSKSTVEAFKYACMALWQFDTPIVVSDRKHYVNGPVYYIAINHIYHVKRMLKELDPHVVSPSKKYKPEYDALKPNNFSPSEMGFKTRPAGKVHCWDITVDSPTSLYCLQNGLVTHNTLSACIIRFYGMIHFRRSGTHMAATMDQSTSATDYLDKFLNIEEILPYHGKNNTREKQLINLPPNSYTKLDNCTLKIIIATSKGVNSFRGSLNISDELELVPPKVLSDAAFISDITRDEHKFSPIDIRLSSLKSNDGPLVKAQKEYEEDRPEDLVLAKWSVADWMAKPPASICKPEEPRRKAWLNTDSLEATWSEEAYEALPEATKALQKEINAYAGCQKCPAFLICQARAPNQTSTSPMLRDVTFIKGLIKKVGDPSQIASQALNWRVDNSAIVFRLFKRHRHYKAPVQAYKWMFAEWFNPLKMDEESLFESWEMGLNIPTKQDIYNAARKAEWKCNYGVDFGVRDMAVCLVILYSKRERKACILHTDASDGYPSPDWAQYIGRNTAPHYPPDLVCPDTADAGAVTYFSRLTPRLPCLDFKPSRIETGVAQIRSLIFDPYTQAEHFCVVDWGKQDNNEYTVQSLEQWPHARTALKGYDFSKFDTDHHLSHVCDAMRYGLAPFIEGGQLKISAAQPKLNHLGQMTAALPDMSKPEQYLKQLVEAQFKDKFGLSNVFSAQENMAKQQAQTHNVKQTAPAKPEEEAPKKPSGSFKFRF